MKYNEMPAFKAKVNNKPGSIHWATCTDKSPQSA